jgi:hypothetical protein
MLRPSTRRLVLLALMSQLLATSGCFLRPKKKSGNKGSDSSSLIERGSIFMDRIGDGDQARVQFKTSKAALCELAFYSQEDGAQPTKEAPTVVACANEASGDAGRTEFTEKLTGLRSDMLYFVIITAWETGSAKGDGESVTVRETPNDSTVIDPGEGDGSFSELLVARFDIPLRTAEFHRHALPEALDSAALKAKLVRQGGCRLGVPADETPFRAAESDMKITNLATRDFAAATAVPHRDHPGRLMTTYASINDGIDKWSLLYQVGGKDLNVPVRPMSRIVNMEMESAEIVAFEDPQLVEAADPLPLDAARPLKIRWTTNGNLRENSYMTVQIGRSDYDKAIYCVFPAEAGTGVVDAALLQEMDAGKHVLLAELSSHQIWVKDGWLVTAYDWRSGRIEK